MTPSPRAPDAGTLLVRALRTMGAAFAVRVDRVGGRPWASATFAGDRHVVALAGPTVPGLRAWLEALPEADFALQGHLVADLCIDTVETIGDTLVATLTILTIEDC